MVSDLKHINYALVEETRPPMYTAIKYWGKKPHNIWSQFVEAYSRVNETTLDPFAGSAVAAFESVKLQRKAIAFDLNPMSAFMIESICSKFNEQSFINAFKKIEKAIEADSIYTEHFKTTYEGKDATVFNYKWTDGKVSGVSIKFDKQSLSIPPDDNDIQNCIKQKNIDIPFWYPTDKFPNHPSISHKFIIDIGGNSFENLWTRRNLYILSKIFNLIKEESDSDLQIQLLSGFVQTLHLCSKMVVPRDSKSKRDFSGSWGRADYMIRRRSMEQNPLIVFRRSCLEKQGILSAAKSFKERFPSGVSIHDVKSTKKLNHKAQINYGSIDIADLSDYLQEGSIDFIITDPPYAGLIQYMDLSLIWLVWLQNINDKYKPDLRPEITVKKGAVTREEYKRRLGNAFKQIHRVLKDEGYLVITFHHQKIQEWNDFIHAVKFAGFKFDKITHQYNKRSGESNVSNPYGTSGADFYIRCVKHRDVDFSDDQSGLEHFVKQKSIEIISQRNQPTPTTILVSALIPELLQAGFFQPSEYRNQLEDILNKNCGENKIFKRSENTESKAGDFWWFNKPSDYINFSDLSLDKRVDDLILSILRRKISVRYDDVIAEVFKTFPNGLTPDVRRLTKELSKYAYKSSDKWKIKEETVTEATNHTIIIEKLIRIGRKSKHKTFVGKREQPEITTTNNPLFNLADLITLTSLSFLNADALKRVEMIDCVWLSEDESSVSCIFEVENSTDFTSAIQRGSNLNAAIIKFMVIPDRRESELLRMNDPYFLTGFINHGWRYLTYTDIDKLVAFTNVDKAELIKVSKELNGRQY